MSNTIIINTRVDAITKRQAQKIAEEMGLSLSSLFRAFLKQFVRTKSISFNVSEKPTDYLLKTLAQSEKDVKEGFVSPSFDNAEDNLKWLNNPKAKYENQIQQKI